MSGTIAVLGLGEAGSALARDLAAAGATVRGYDPLVPATRGAVADARNATDASTERTAADTAKPGTTGNTGADTAKPGATGNTGATSAAGTAKPGATGNTEATAEPATWDIVLTGSEAEAADGADLVLSVNSASAAADALEAGLGGLRPGAVWADLNTASPGTKRKLAAIAAARGVPFADIAIMAPVPGRGLRVPMLATGAAAEAVATLLNSFGAAVEVMAGDAGLAAERKLLRSVFFKGMSAAVVEALQAARAAGCEDWLRKIIVDELTAASASTVDRLVDGSFKHAVRRTSEMAAAAEMLGELGVRADVAGAARDQLARIADSSTTPAAGRAPVSG
ncbi:hypothetical protein GCM10027258_89110 [Amycolatopsis stemonae]